MEMIAYQPELSPALPVVIGNIDYHQYRVTLKRIDQLLRNSGVESSFTRHYLAEAERRGREHAADAGCAYRAPSAKVVARLAEHAVLALRCNIIRILESNSYRRTSQRLADSPLLQWFCGINRMDVIKVPSKSSIERYDKSVPESVLREVVNQLTRAAADVDGQGQSVIGLETPLSLSTLLLDTTCVKANIHFPVDWVLLRDASRTLLKAIVLIRKQGLKNRMTSPADFSKSVNRLCIEMTHTRRRKDGLKHRKRVLRLLKKMSRRIDRHARRHRNLLANQWQQTDLSEDEARQIIARIDNIRGQLPAAIKQAHERIIGGRRVANKDKTLSLYESDIYVIVRGKSGSEVEFGNTFLLAEQQAGVIVDWDLLKGSKSDSKLVKGSLGRFGQAFGELPDAVVGDRGFDSPDNRNAPRNAGHPGMYNAICPKSPKALSERMKETRFCELQNRRSQSEGRIGIFKNNFLGRLFRSKGFGSRQRDITWSVLTHNLWVIGRLSQADDNRNRHTQAA
jgi:hypothetical protein